MEPHPEGERRIEYDAYTITPGRPQQGGRKLLPPSADEGTMHGRESRNINLDRAVASYLEMRRIAWELGLASLLREGRPRPEAVRRLADAWARASLARERRWRPRAHARVRERR